MLSEGRLRALNDFIEKTSKEELIWINGYIAGLISSSGLKTSETTTSQKKFTILYGTDTGNSKNLALEFSAAAKKQGAKVKMVGMDTYKTDELKHEKFLCIILSTHGDGDPPPSAKKFYDYLMDTSTLYPELEFAILAPGDTSYPYYCKAGDDVHQRLVALGANPVFPVQKCDVDYQDDANAWYQTYLNSFPVEVPKESLAPAKKVSHGKKWYTGIIQTNTNLNGHTSNKETHHIEIRTLEPVIYEPGDSLGIIPKNKKSTVDLILQMVHIDPMLSVPYKSGGHTLVHLLTNVLNISFLKESQVQKYADLHEHEIPKIRMDLIDLVRLYPVLHANLFIEFITHLNEQTPRLYSICSSPRVREFEIHILVSKNTFTAMNEVKYGLASDQLSEYEESSSIDFYIHKNKSFRLPSPETDMIMIGPGTGIAPMRSFIEDRDAIGAEGKNWLIFGEQHFISDFFYQTEIQQYSSTGSLSRVDLAWSRDQKEKYYVQHRMLEKGKELYEWIQRGAHVYISGTRSPMSEDVEKAWIDIFYTHGGKSAPEAEDFLNELKESGQYKADVY